MEEIEKQKTFEERMKARIRDSIGELMTDEELSKIVKRVTEKVFFEPVRLGEGYQMKEHPPFIHQIIKELLTDSVRSQVGEYFVKNKEKIAESIKEIIQTGIGQALLNALTMKFDMDMSMFQNNLINTLQNP